MAGRPSPPRVPRDHASSFALPPFVGQVELLERLARAFAEGARLVTLLGAPGVGKSRVAGRYLELSEVPPKLLEDASADDVLAVWANEPSRPVLVASRKRVGLPNEILLEVLPLGCPEEDASDEAIAASDAVRLFVSRAEAVGGDLDGNWPTLGALARRFEGIPLAIEVAAARTRACSPSELLAKSAQNDAASGVLGEAIAFSLAGLAPHDREALAALTVFAGPFTLAAAEAVLGPAAADRIVSLRDQSLLGCPQRGVFALYATIREAAHRTLVTSDAARAYERRHASYYADRCVPYNASRTFTEASPRPQLRGELLLERDNVLAAHDYARADGDAERTAILATAIALLEAASAERCLAMLTAARAGLPESAVELHALVLIARQNAFQAQGRFAESEADFEAISALNDLSPALRAETLLLRGVGLWYRTDYEAAWGFHEQADRLLADVTAPRLAALSRACLGRIRHELGDSVGARLHDEASRELCRAMGDRWLEALPLANLAQVEQEAGNLALAADHLDQALASFRATSETHYERIYLGILGDLSFERGLFAEARHAYDAALRGLSGPRPFRSLALVNGARGALEAQTGDRARAEESFRAAWAALRHVEARRIRIALGLHESSLTIRVARDTGDIHAARQAEHAARQRLLALTDEDEHALWSIDVRFARRLLSRWLETTTTPASDEPTKARPTVVLGPDLAWFSLDRGPKISLLRRGPVRRLLAALVAAHATAPRSSVPADRLIAAAWPEERMLPSAASTRLRVGIATLRSLGLRPVLLTHEDGYALDPDMRTETAVR